MGSDWLKVKTKRYNPSEQSLVIRSPPLLPGSVLHCGYGVVTGRCLRAHFGSSPTAYLRDKPPPRDERLLRGSRPPAAVD